MHQLVPDLNGRTPTLALAIHQLVPDHNGRTPTPFLKLGDLDCTVITQLPSITQITPKIILPCIIAKCEYVAYITMLTLL